MLHQTHSHLFKLINVLALTAQVVRPQCSGDGVKKTAYHVHESCESVHAFDGGAKAERRYILFVGEFRVIEHVD